MYVVKTAKHPVANFCLPKLGHINLMDLVTNRERKNSNSEDQWFGSLEALNYVLCLQTLHYMLAAQ